MSRRAELSQWTDQVATQFSHLSKPQATVLALWSFGIVLAGSCAQTTVVSFLLPWAGRSFSTTRQRLREWLWDANDKAGRRRRQLEVMGCFPKLTRWVLQRQRGGAHRRDLPVVLGLDATTLGDRITVLAISVLCGHVAVPIAWAMLPGNRPKEWKPLWESLMDAVRVGIPRDTPVLVLADRGLSGAWLFRQIRNRRWHPLIRVKCIGSFRPHGQPCWRPFASLAPQPGSDWRGVGTAYKKSGSRIEATLLAYWEKNTENPWFLLTDLLPEAVDPRWYGRRMWIEEGFRVIKRAQWKWNRTRMSDPARVERLWLAIALATLWTLSAGDCRRTWDLTGASLSFQFDKDGARRINPVTFGRAVVITTLIAHGLIHLGEIDMNLPGWPMLQSPGSTPQAGSGSQ